MTTLDTIVASAEDTLLPGLNFSLNNRKGAFIRASARADHLLPDNLVVSTARHRSAG
jgi:hypothetical protein